MDEPSTGLDPASRKQLWRAIRRAKQRGSCGIVLTTHSMQEAEELCDDLGIIKNGKIVASGTPISLVRAYGNFLEVHMNLPQERHSDAEALLRSLSPSLDVKSGLGGTVKYELSGAETTVQEVFATVTEHRVKLEIEDWGVHNSSLEDVFVKLYDDDQPVTSPGEVRLRDTPDDVDLESKKEVPTENRTVPQVNHPDTPEPPGTPEESEPVSAE
jgi:ABC-type multidrug transport system ATPase subunit